MKKTLLVFRNELAVTVKRKSFLVTLFLLPIIGSLVAIIAGNSQSEGNNNVISQIFAPQEQLKIQGIVDQSSLIKSLPADYQDVFALYDTGEAANADLEAGVISAYYLIDSNYIQNGKITLFKPDFNPLGGHNLDNTLESLLTTQLLANQPGLVNRVENPLQLNTTILSPEPQRDPESGLTFFLPYAVTMIFYIVILSSASLMLNSVTKEKTNRMMEILMTSINPTQMLTGKIMALGLVGLLQTLVWSGTGYLLLRLSGRTFNLSSAFQLPISILIWGIVFFLCGYALYASLMAGVGALVPNLREASQATTLMVIPLVIPLMLISAIIENPNGALAMVFSLFPLTAPVTMMTRLSAGSVPLWQIFLAVVLLIASAYFVIRSVSGFFRAQNLLSGQEFKINYFI